VDTLFVQPHLTLLWSGSALTRLSEQREVTKRASEGLVIRSDHFAPKWQAASTVSLEIAGRYLPVVPTALREDAWAYLPDPDKVSWLAGSYVNVVLGLPYTDENLALVAGTLRSTAFSAVALSDTITVRTSVAGTNHYRVAERLQVGIYEIEALSQRRAGLTLVLLGGNEEASNERPDRRLIIWAVPVEIETEE